MTIDELLTVKEYARKHGFYVNDKSWGFKEMFSIKFTSEHTWSTLLDATYADLNIIGMPKHFTFRYYKDKCCTIDNKKIYDIRNISLNFIKKKLDWYSTAPKRYAEYLKIKELNKDFK